MRPKGIVYRSGKSGTHGEIILLLPRVLRLGYNFVRGIGAGLIAFAILTWAFSFGPVVEQEVSFRFAGQRQTQDDRTIPLEVEAERIRDVQNEANSAGVNSNFSIIIPKIGATSNIIANVDVNKKAEYLEALKKGVSHAKGTYFPGQGGTIFLFSHSTDSPLNFARYNAVFYLLRKLEEGDEIIIYFADRKYRYKVVEKIITKASDTSWLNPQLDEEKLILMTCDPPGTTWRRLLVIAKPD